MPAECSKIELDDKRWHDLNCDCQEPGEEKMANNKLMSIASEASCIECQIHSEPQISQSLQATV